MPIGETPHFEDPDYGRDGRDALLKLFAGRTEARVGIKRPNYLAMPEVPARIAADCPGAPLIAVLRDPVDRALSAFFHQIKTGFFEPEDPESGLRRIFEAYRDGRTQALTRREREVVDFGFYHEHLRRYQHHLDLDLLLLWLHEDVRDRPREVLRDTYQYLGVNTDFVPEEELQRRPQAVIYSLPRLRWYRWRSRLAYRFDPKTERILGKRRNPAALAAAGLVDAVDRVVLSRISDNRKPKLSPGLVDLMCGVYTDDCRALQELLGRDLSHWKPLRQTLS